MTPRVNGIVRLSREQGGLAAVEFALCFPMLLVIYFSTFAYWQAHRGDDRLATAAVTTVELATRSYYVNDATIERIFGVAEAVANPQNAGASFHIVLSSISNPIDGDPDGSDYEIDWSASNISDQEFQDVDLVKLDLPVIAQGDSIIHAHLSTEFSLLMLADVPPVTFSHSAVRRPRFVSRVPYE